MRAKDPPTHPDAALLAGLMAGDRGKANTFFADFEPVARSAAFRILGDEHLSEDVAQQALERAWRRGSSFDHDRGTVGAWIATIARNLAIDEVRRSRTNAHDPILVSALDRREVLSCPADEVVLGEQVEQVRLALARLPESQRRAVVLTTVHGRTAAEVAEIEQIPVGTAKTRIRSGLIRLRTRLSAA